MNKKYDGDCIFWDGKFSTNGYGVDSRGRQSHNLTWEKHNGPVPPDKVVAHTCNIRGCVNIQHLYLKSPAKFKHTRDYVEIGRGRNKKVVVAHETKSAVSTSRNLKRIRQLDFTKDELNKLFTYTEGNLFWKESARGRTKGKRIGTVDTKIPIVGCSVRSVRCGLHELVWVFFNGPIKENQRIIFKDGNALNCNIENLTLVEVT